MASAEGVGVVGAKDAVVGKEFSGDDAGWVKVSYAKRRGAVKDGSKGGEGLKVVEEVSATTSTPGRFLKQI